MISILVALTLGQLSVRQDGGVVGQVSAVNCIGPGATCTRAGSTWVLQVDAGTAGDVLHPVDAEFITYAANATLTAERVLSAGNYTTVDLATAGQAQVDWSHGLTCSSGQALTSSGTTALACTSTITASDLACSGCVSDAELANNYSGTGPCGSNLYVTGVNDNAAPTCAAIPTMSATVIGGVKGDGASTQCGGTNKVTGFASGVMQCGVDATGYGTIQNEAVALTTRNIVNFTGSGVDCVDNAADSRTDCTVTGGGGTLDAGTDLQPWGGYTEIRENALGHVPFSVHAPTKAGTIRRLSFRSHAAGTNGAGTAQTLRVVGATSGTLCDLAVPCTSAGGTLSGSCSGAFAAGERLDVGWYQDVSASAACNSTPSGNAVLEVESTGATGAGGGGITTPHVKAHTNANLTLPNNASTAVTYQVEEWDSDSAFATSGGRSRFTVPAGAAGKYRITMQERMQFAATNISYLVEPTVTKNGGAGATYGAYAGVTGGSLTYIYVSVNGSAELDLAAGDYLEFSIYQTNSSGIAATLESVNNSSFITIQRIR